MYECRICDFKTLSPYSYMKHFRVHSGAITVPCGVPGCSRTFRKLGAFYCHLSRDHLRRQRSSNFLQNVGCTIRCEVDSCQQLIPFNDMVKHLKVHIAAGQTIKCPALGCGRKMTKRSTFSAHISIKHGTINKNNIKNDMIISPDADAPARDEDSEEVADSDSSCMLQNIPDTSESLLDLQGVESPVFIRNLGLFLLKLQCRYHIASSTVQLIADEMQNLHQLGMENSFKALQSKLLSAGVNANTIELALSEVKKADVFHVSLNSNDGILRSHHKRLQFYKDNLLYNEPVQITLGNTVSGKPVFCHYIPITETIKRLLTDAAVLQCCISPKAFQLGVYEDLCDGTVYTNISQTVGDSTFLELILYQDAFEIVNPLGSAKKVHKMVAVYLVLGNLPCHVRMKMDNLQLVMLCRDTDLTRFGQRTVFESLISELTGLERNGLTFSGRFFQVRLVCVLGDNLGSHWLGGFSTNFSTNSFICRYCLVEKVCDNSYSLASIAEMRTPANYNVDADCAANGATFHGVVGRSLFNVLNFYHVCMPGLPPCLGHDLFEGVIQYDLALLLKELCKGTTDMSIGYLNDSIKVFKFKGSDARDKPGLISSGPSIGGHAVQNWCFLRLLPLLLFDVVDVASECWKLLLLLREVVELVCAPKLSETQVLYLNRLVEVYVEERARLFPMVALRPKHHYLLHYPWLIMMFGPLIHVWTMRLESKHSFFKRCCRTKHNYINVTKTLSETHQLNQALMSTGTVLCGEVELGSDSMPFDRKVFANNICSAVMNCSHLSSPLHCSAVLTFRGVKYSKDDFVVIDRNETVIGFGKIVLCIVDSCGKCAAVVNLFSSQKHDVLGMYTVTETSCYKCVLIQDLWDYCPLPSYNITGLQCIALKHSLFDSIAE